MRVQIACGAPDSFFSGHGKVAPRSAGPRRCRVGERSQQVKAREVSCTNVVIGLKWVWRERGIVNAAHSGGMLVADTVRSGTKAKLEGSTSGQRWRVIDTGRSLFFHGRRGECEKCSET